MNAVKKSMVPLLREGGPLTGKRHLTQSLYERKVRMCELWTVSSFLVTLQKPTPHFFFFILKNFVEVKLIYNVVLISAIQQSDTYILYFDSFPKWVITEYWVEFPVLYSRTSLPIHSIYNRAHMPNPNFYLKKYAEKFSSEEVLPFDHGKYNNGLKI